MRRIRGNDIAMIFQEPMSSLNPVYSIGSQICEAIRLHQRLTERAARATALDLLQQLGIPNPERCLKSYPHQLSGGMRQRVMIAIALSCRPSLLIADEPTTALDVTIQAQILELLKKLQTQTGMAMIFITHNLGGSFRDRGPRPSSCMPARRSNPVRSARSFALRACPTRWRCCSRCPALARRAHPAGACARSPGMCQTRWRCRQAARFIRVAPISIRALR